MLNFWILLSIFWCVSLLGTAIGFKRYIWFLSIGYGITVMLLAISYLIFGFVVKSYDFISLIQIFILIVYGFRLSYFLFKREFYSKSYNKAMEGTSFKRENKTISPFLLIGLWIYISLLYTAQTSAIFFRIYNLKVDNITSSFAFLNQGLGIIGLVISIFGLIIEAIADRQKTNQKKINPNMVATKGLYKYVRCANYFGEIVFWFGFFIGCIGCFNNHVAQYIIAAIGLIAINVIMIFGAKTRDKRQEASYGHLKEYRDYADHTPIIFPFLPIYHIGKYKNNNKNNNH